MIKNIENRIEKELNESIKQNEVPVVAIVLKNNKIISCAYNKKNKYKSALCHAEILAIKKASKKLKTWILNDCELITTLKPCQMCSEVLKEYRISKVSYYVDNYYNNKTVINYTKINNEYSKIYKNKLQLFFKNKRK